MTNSIKVHSPAKINWLLRVGPPRPDGYHDICSVMQTLALGDIITITRRDDDQCFLSGFPSDIIPDKNLAFKAWQAMQDVHPSHVRGVDIHIKKVLPQGGGLGGGSSNAATVIHGLAELFQIPILSTPDATAHLRSIASMIGSDIPFFIPGGTAIVSGRGEHVNPLPPAPLYHFVLIFPKQGMSTPEAYRQLDAATDRITALPSQADLDKFTQTLMAGDPLALADSIDNDFERVSAHYDWFLDARQKLEHAGVLRAFLCGSGSTVAGLCIDQKSALAIAANVGGLYTYSSTTPFTLD